ncbi:MAG TPA: hypothetical protein VIN60_02190 [Anaerolineales bacterium]
MSDKEVVDPKGKQQGVVAKWVLIVGAVILVALGVTAIIIDHQNTMTIFNIILPVVASWIGTVLAFYFGRENFESANEQVRALVQRMSPEEVNNELVTELMRPIYDMIFFQIPEGKDDKDVKLSELRAKFSDKVSRLPILDSKKAPKYMIHQSRIDNYLAPDGGGTVDDTLDIFIAKQKEKHLEFGLNQGFVVVSDQTLVAEAKRKMESPESCQDIFVTKSGKADEPLIGWVSNLKLGQYLEA